MGTLGDKGVIIYNNSKVPREYRHRVRIRNLEMFIDRGNINFWADLINNPEYVDIRPDGKKLWKGKLNNDGYSLVNTKILPFRPPGFEKGITVLGHRLSYTFLIENAPTNACVCHRSNVRNNLEPSDLYLGTFAQNSGQIRMQERRIYPKGEDHWSSKLTGDKVVAMVHLYFSNAVTIGEIARRFGVSRGTTSAVVNCRGPWAAIANNAKDAALAARMGN